MLVFLKNGMAAMFAFLTNPPGIELYYQATYSFVSGGKNKVTDHLSEDT